MFWGVEFVEDKATKRAFDVRKNLTSRVVKAGLEVSCVKLYTCSLCHTTIAYLSRRPDLGDCVGSFTAFKLAQEGIMLVGGSPGCADGVNGDQLQLSPPLVMTEAQIDDAVRMLADAIETVRLEVAAEVAVAVAQ